MDFQLDAVGWREEIEKDQERWTQLDVYTFVVQCEQYQNSDQRKIFDIPSADVLTVS